MNSQSDTSQVDPIVEVERLHAEAMEQYDKALSLRRKDDSEQFTVLASEALELEARAAWAYTMLESAIEPARTILFKGAAVIAAELKRHKDVIHLAGAGLSHCEDSPLRQDLMRLLKQANFELEIMERDGIALSNSSLQFSIDGAAVGDGCAREDIFRGYLDPMVTLVRRTWQRLQGMEFNDKTAKERCPIYLAPTHGSMAVEFYLGEMIQPTLPGFEKYTTNATTVVSDIVHALEALQNDESDQLDQLIPDEVYRRNFVELSRKILPKGDDVNVVKLIANTDTPESVTLTRRIDRQKIALKRTKLQPRIVEVIGQLLLADGLTSGSETVGIRTDDGKTFSIKVPAHMMDDIVRPLWHKRVIASVQLRPKGRGESRLLVHCDEASNES